MKGSRRTRRESFLSRVDRRLLVRVVTLGVSAFIVGYTLTALAFFRGSSRPRVVTVPDLRESSYSAARRVADRADLDLELGDSLPHPSVPAGAVLAQSPLPGSEAAPGSTVRVILSTGRARREVPDVDSLPRYQAERILAGAGFELSILEVPDLRDPGSVVGVQPEAGTVVQLPARVQLLISAGPPITEVPLVVGLHETEATRVLEVAGFEVGEVRHEFGGFLRAGEVMEQFPAAGDSLAAGSEIDITVASLRSSS